MKYNKLNINRKRMLWTSFELSFERFSLEAWLPAGVRENEPVLKRKSSLTGIQAMEYTFS